MTSALAGKSWEPVSKAPDNLYSFEPDPRRVRFLDGRMRAELAGSIRYLVEQLAEHVALPDLEIAKFVARLEAEPTSPLTFALYGDLVLAIDRDDLDAAADLVRTMVAQPEFTPGPHIIALGDPESDLTADRYRRYVDTDPEVRFAYYAPPADAAEACRSLVERALSLLDEADLALGGEIREILHEIIMAAGTREKGSYTFDGASSPMLWGGVVINVHRRGDLVKMVQMIAHEAAHNLLFGLCPDSELMDNDPAERHDSPLRPDRRPLAGIYHAVFVSARMQQALKAVADKGLFPIELSRRVQSDLAVNARAFQSGMETLQEHARLTPLGTKILANAAAYMDQNR